MKNPFSKLFDGSPHNNVARPISSNPIRDIPPVHYGSEVSVSQDWFELRGHRYKRRQLIDVKPPLGSLSPTLNLDDTLEVSTAVPARDEVFVHLTSQMVDVLARVADIDHNPSLNMFVLLSGPTGCGKTTLAKTYCHLANQPITELNFSGDTTLNDFFRGTEIITNADGSQGTLASLGPAALAMLLGKKLIINEINMLPPDLLGVITQAMDTGRLLLSSTKYGNIEIELHEEFGIIATANPNYVGTAEIGRSLYRRFGLGLGNVPVSFLSPDQETESLLIEFTRHPVIEALGVISDDGIAGRLVRMADTLRNHPEIGGEMRDRISTRTLVHWLSLGQLTGLPLSDIGNRAILTIAPPLIRAQVEQISRAALSGARTSPSKQNLAGTLLTENPPEPGKAVDVPVPEPAHTQEQERLQEADEIPLPSGITAVLERIEGKPPLLWAYDHEGRPLTDTDDKYHVRAELRREHGINIPMPIGHIPRRQEILPCLTKSTWISIRLTQATLLLNRPVFLRGPTGTGKSALARTVAYLWNLKTVEFAFTGETAKSDLTAVRQLRDGSTQWNAQAFLEAVHRGHLVIINDYNMAYPDVHSVINGLFDKAGLITLPDGSEIRAHPDFRLIATGFPDGPGVKPLNEGVENRFGAIVAVHYPSYEEELAILEFVAKERMERTSLKGMAELASIARSILQGDIDLDFAGGPNSIAPDIAASVAEQTALTTAEMVTMIRGARDNNELVRWYRRGVLDGTSQEVSRVLDPVLSNYSLG